MNPLKPLYDVRVYLTKTLLNAYNTGRVAQIRHPQLPLEQAIQELTPEQRNRYSAIVFARKVGRERFEGPVILNSSLNRTMLAFQHPLNQVVANLVDFLRDFEADSPRGLSRIHVYSRTNITEEESKRVIERVRQLHF